MAFERFKRRHWFGKSYVVYLGLYYLVDWLIWGLEQQHSLDRSNYIMCCEIFLVSLMFHPLLRNVWVNLQAVGQTKYPCVFTSFLKALFVWNHYYFNEHLHIMTRRNCCNCFLLLWREKYTFLLFIFDTKRRNFYNGKKSSFMEYIVV